MPDHTQFKAVAEVKNVTLECQDTIYCHTHTQNVYCLIFQQIHAVFISERGGGEEE